jgi:hypothetical protein
VALKLKDIRLDINWSAVSFVPEKPTYSTVENVQPKSHVIFKSVFRNDCYIEQSHSLKTQRQTTAICTSSLDVSFAFLIEKPFSNPTEAFATSPGAAKVRPTLSPLVHPFTKELVQIAVVWRCVFNEWDCSKMSADIIDLEEAVETWAWKAYNETCSGKALKLKDIRMDINWSAVSFVPEKHSDIITKIKVNSDDQQFHKYQRNEQLPLMLYNYFCNNC